MTTRTTNCTAGNRNEASGSMQRARQANADIMAAALAFGEAGRVSTNAASALPGAAAAPEGVVANDADRPATGSISGVQSVEQRAAASGRASGLADEWARLDAEGQTVRLRLGSALNLVAQSREKLLGLRAKVSCADTRTT